MNVFPKGWKLVPIEPTAIQLTAMANERQNGKRRNGHGDHSYRDEYLAALAASPNPPNMDK